MPTNINSSSILDSFSWPFESLTTDATREDMDNVIRRISERIPNNSSKYYTKEETKIKNDDLVQTTMPNGVIEMKKFSETVVVRWLGHFLKTDPNIVEDYLDSSNYLHIYNSKTTKIFDKINEKGIFEGYVYTERKDYPYLPYVYDVGYITLELLDNEIFKKYYIENIVEGFFQKRNKENNFELHNKIVGLKSKCSFDDFFKNIKKENKPLTYIKTFGKKYTFGVEIETHSGRLPLYLKNKLFYSSVYDGSLKHKDDSSTYGLEYVSAVLQGDEGLKQLNSLCYELTKRCLLNYQCGEKNATL